MILHTPDNALMVPADARAVGITTARTTSQRRDPRDRCIALSPCVSIMPDGTRTVFIPASKRAASKRKRTAVIVNTREHRTLFDRSNFAPIGNID